MQQALGLIETKGLLAAIESADAMLKAAEVSLLERTLVGGGLVTISVTGDVAAVKASVEAGVAAVSRIDASLLVSDHVIPRPHMELDDVILPAEPLKDRNAPAKEPLKQAEPETEPEPEITAEPETVTEPEVTVEPETIIKPETIAETETAEPETAVETETSETESVTEHSAAAETEAGAVKLQEPEEPENRETAETEEEPEKDTVLETVQETETEIEIPAEGIHKEELEDLIGRHGLASVIEALGKCKVMKLRHLAREYEDFGISGRMISKADKKTLIAEFEKYYQ